SLLQVGVEFHAVRLATGTLPDAGIDCLSLKKRSHTHEQSTAVCTGERGRKRKADLQADVDGSENRFHPQARRLHYFVRDDLPEHHDRLPGRRFSGPWVASGPERPGTSANTTSCRGSALPASVRRIASRLTIS